MKAQDLMTANPACCTPDDSVERVAQLMADNDCGSVPVVSSRTDGRVVGVITDRDIVIRGVAAGKGPDTRVRALMTPDPFCCSADADIKDIERVMAEQQVRRVIVVDSGRSCIGVIAQADLARAAERRKDVSDAEVARLVERISEPRPGHASGSTPPGASELSM
jgi:CBS domain-containing protein